MEKIIQIKYKGNNVFKSMYRNRRIIIPCKQYCNIDLGLAKSFYLMFGHDGFLENFDVSKDVLDSLCGGFKPQVESEVKSKQTETKKDSSESENEQVKKPSNLINMIGKITKVKKSKKLK